MPFIFCQIVLIVMFSQPYMMILSSQNNTANNGCGGVMGNAQSLPISVLALINPLLSTPQSAIEPVKRPRQKSLNAGSFS